MYRLLVITGGLFLHFCCLVSSDDELTTSVADKTESTTLVTPIDRSSHFQHPNPTFHGFWKKKLIWRPRWVKTWHEKKVYIAVWKKMWGPTILKEWVPIPKPPPGWVKFNIGGLAIKNIPH